MSYGPRFFGKKYSMVFAFLLLANSPMLFGMLFSLVSATPQFWVSPSGSDTTGTGASNAPWATIGKARDYIRLNHLNKKMAGDIVVNITSGEYPVLGSVKFIPEDSGADGHYIIYRAVDGPGTVNLVGSADVNGWTIFSNDIWRVYVGANRTIETIYENNVRGRLARSPDYIHNARYPLAQAPYKLSVTGGYDTVSSMDWLQYNEGDFLITDTPPPTARVNWWVAGGYADWGMVAAPLFTNNVSTSRLYFTNASYSPDVNESSDRYFVAGISSYLDQAGEFYYSKSGADNGWLYYFARAGGNPDDQDMRVPLSTSPALISVAGSAPGTRVHHLKFEGLTLAYTSLGTVAQGALNLQSTDHIEVRNCHIHNVGHAAIQMYKDNVSNLVYGCWIEHCGVGGIWVRNLLLRVDYPDAKSEFNIISNCKIHDVGEVTVDQLWTAGVVLAGTSNSEVSYCDIFNSPRYATTLKGPWGGIYYEDSGQHYTVNNVFKYIRATDCMQDSGDGSVLHAARCSEAGVNHTNYYQQILISGVYSDPSMQDLHSAVGIYFDLQQSTLNQSFSNIQMNWIQDFRSPSGGSVETRDRNRYFRGNGNPFADQTWRNISWTNDSLGNAFNENLMEYSKIGIKPDFPEVYDLQDTVISDDHTLDYTESDASWVDTAIGSLNKGDGRFHNSASSSQFAAWCPVFPSTRQYEVLVWKMANSVSASSNAPYTVFYEGGSTNFTVDQQTGISGWVSVGTYPFKYGRSATSGAVKLFANPADGKQVRADAIKFVAKRPEFSDPLGGEKGWWGFDYTNTDASGLGHTAIASSYSAVSKVGTGSLYCNGASCGIVIDHPDLDIGTGDFAISLWFWRDANTTNNLRILSKGAVTDTDVGYCIFGSDSTVSFALSSGDVNKPRKMLTGTHLGTNQWNHIAVNISRTGYMTLYMNGVQADEENISDWKDLDLGSPHWLNFGRDAATDTLFWFGRIDEGAVFQRVLSDLEIETLAR